MNNVKRCKWCNLKNKLYIGMIIFIIVFTLLSSYAQNETLWQKKDLEASEQSSLHVNKKFTP